MRDLSSICGASPLLRTRTALSRYRLWFGCIAVLIFLATASASSGAKPTPTAEVNTSAAMPQNIPQYNEPALEVDNFQQSVSKAKVMFRLPTFYLRSTFQQFKFCGIQMDPGVKLGDACPKFLSLPSDPRYYQTSNNMILTSLDYYVVSKPGPPSTYGAFPKVRVRALAFGSIPVSATVALQQTATGKYLNPLTVNFAFFSNLIATGTKPWPNFPPIPASKNSLSLDIYYKLVGDVDVKVSDVTIDGHQIDVGASCQTEKPAHLSVTPPLGYYVPVNDTDPSQSPPTKRGQPGFFGVVNSVPGTFDGSVSIPPFRGCKDRNQSFDRLLTSFISGPANPVSGFVPHVVLNAWCQYPVAKVDCAGQPTEGLRVGAQVKRSVTAKSLAKISKLLALSISH